MFEREIRHRTVHLCSCRSTGKNCRFQSFSPNPNQDSWCTLSWRQTTDSTKQGRFSSPSTSRNVKLFRRDSEIHGFFFFYHASLLSRAHCVRPSEYADTVVCDKTVSGRPCIVVLRNLDSTGVVAPEVDTRRKCGNFVRWFSTSALLPGRLAFSRKSHIHIRELVRPDGPSTVRADEDSTPGRQFRKQIGIMDPSPILRHTYLPVVRLSNTRLG